MLPRRDSKPLEYPALLPMFGGMEKKPRFLDREVITMGRARGSDFCLDGNEVSALHCIIYLASDGYRVRDCGSRTGTRVNGQSVKNALLGNGDVLQIGPFSFEVRIPKNIDTQAPVDPTRVERLKRSRSHLVHLALRLRKKLLIKKPSPNGYASSNGNGNGANLADSAPNDKKAAELKAKIKQYDQKVNQLEESEKELFDEKEAHKKLIREFEDKCKVREADLEYRAKQLEDEFKKRSSILQVELQKAKAAPAGPSPEQLHELQELQAKKKELEALEKKLKTRDTDVNDDYKEILKERDQVEKLRQQWEQDQIDARKQLEQQKETISCAEFTLHDQKSQLGTMIDQLKHMQDELRASSQGETVQLQQQIAQLKRELSDARAPKPQSAGDGAEVKQLRDSLAAAKAEIAALSQTLQQTTGLSGEVEALQREMQSAQISLQQQVHSLQAENQLLRSQVVETSAPPSPVEPDPRLAQLAVENETLKQLANDFQQRLAAAEAAATTHDVDALKNENESLRMLLAQLEAEQKSAPPMAALDDEVKQENQVLRRLLEEAETDLQRFKNAPVGLLDSPSRELDQLRNENDLLHKLLREKDSMMEEFHDLAAGKDGRTPAQVEVMQNELQVLKDLLRDKDGLIEELKQEAERIPGGDPESYEAELNRFRKELESDRGRLNKEIDSLRQRNQELDDATRELEMELSRERAEMARERIRLDRMRDEVKADMERLQREQDVRGSLGGVQKLREEITQKSAGGPPKSTVDRLRTMSKLP